MRLRMHVMGVGHVMRHDAGRIGDETLGAGPGLSGCRDGFGTEPGMSHNRLAIFAHFLEAPGVLGQHVAFGIEQWFFLLMLVLLQLRLLAG